MVEVADALSECNYLIIAFATIKRDIAPSKNILKQCGCDNIIIYNYRMLKAALFS
jgi:hypothetical protein